MQKTPLRFRFYWRAIHSEGQQLQGHIEASSKTIAAILLARQGIHPYQLKRARGHAVQFNKKRLIISFFKQLTVLLRANLSLMQALETLRKTQHHPLLKQIIEKIQQHLKEGLPFSKALEAYPRYFTPLMCQLIRIGEQASQFDNIIFNLTRHEEQQLQVQREFYLTLAYPLLILIISTSLILGLCLFVLPHFLSFYQSFQVVLPKPTQILIALTNTIKAYGIVGIIFLLWTGFTTSFLYQKYPSFKQSLDLLLLRTPYLGSYLSKLILSRLASTLSLTLNAGLPLLDALELLVHIAQNVPYEHAILYIHAQVREGSSLSQAMRTSQRFSSDFLQMVAIGEESGKLASMFSEIAKHYEETINHQTALWSKLLEPLIMIVLGVVMGFFLLALYLPIFELGAAF